MTKEITNLDVFNTTLKEFRTWNVELDPAWDFHEEDFIENGGIDVPCWKCNGK